MALAWKLKSPCLRLGWYAASLGEVRCVRFKSFTPGMRHKYYKKRSVTDSPTDHLVMTGVSTADTYNLKLLPSIVRQSDQFSLVDVHADCRNHVVQVKETLPNDQQRTAFIFKFGAAVLWNADADATSKDIRTLLDVLLRPIERGKSQPDATVLADLEQMDYVVSSSTSKSHVEGESLVLSEGQSQGDENKEFKLAEDEVAVSHALAKSVKLSTVESQLERYVSECRGLLAGKLHRMKSKEAWSRMLEVSDLDSKANHPPVEMEDFYWDRMEQDTLHNQVLRVYDYKKRIAEFNQMLNCCKEFANCHYSHTVQVRDDILTYLIIILILVDVVLGQL